jgi:hypothetical protein
MRSFDREAMQEYFSERGFDTFTDTNGLSTTLSFFDGTPAGNGAFGLLSPSIYALQMDESAGELHITGLFDPTVSATVQISGNGSKQIDVQPTSATTLVCPLPGDQQPTAGDVTVIQQGHPSNTVPLSEWRLQITGVRYFADTPPPSATFNFNIHLRADVHTARNKPYAKPVMLTTFAQAASDSTCTLVDASGTYQSPDPSLDYTVQWSLPAPVSLPITYVGFPGGQALNFAGSATFQSGGGVQLNVSAVAPNTILVTETQMGHKTVYPFDPGTRDYPPVNTSLDPKTFAIQGAQGPAAGDSGIFTIYTGIPEFAPDDSAPGHAD